MLRRILVGLDGTEYSSAAVELGLRWARGYNAVLLGLGIIDEPTIRMPEPVPLGASHYKVERDEHLLADARRRVEQFLEQFAQRCAAAGVPCQVLEDTGMPYEQILKESRQCDVILLGQQTNFHFETQDEPDETLTRVLRQTSRPVVAVPRTLPEGRAVVAAYNGSPAADRALQAFQGLGLASSDEVHVISIDADLAQAARLAEQAAGFLGIHGIRAVPRPLAYSASVSELILSQVRELKAHLLVMGAYGSPMWREFLFGSLTNRLLPESPVPVFLCH